MMVYMLCCHCWSQLILSAHLLTTSSDSDLGMQRLRIVRGETSATRAHGRARLAPTALHLGATESLRRHEHTHNGAGDGLGLGLQSHAKG